MLTHQLVILPLAINGQIHTNPQKAINWAHYVVVAVGWFGGGRGREGEQWSTDAIWSNIVYPGS